MGVPDLLPDPVGHDVVRRALETELPPVALLLGPASIGKRTVVEHVLAHHKIKAVDTRRITKLTTDDARSLIEFARTAPFGRKKVVFARLDGASESALNAMLKLWEEPPRTISFLLTAVWPPLTTVLSRSHVYRMGQLTDDQLIAVLTRLGVPPGKAATSAALGRGQVKVALRAEITDASRNAVLGVLKAVQSKDPELLDAAASKWDQDAHDLLHRWLIEAITGRWSVFTDSETFGLSADRVLVRKMFVAHGVPARPKIALRAGLLPMLTTGPTTT